ncbi:MAG: FG-GAP-like repeat-containing protein [Actinomycetota bacterium]|nr:FG-GAP-like repeat-containing protein [Actinomycetota bacterium]
MIARIPVLLAAGLAVLALGAPAAFAATPATPYDFLRLESFEPQGIPGNPGAGGRFADRMKSAGDLDRDGVGDVWISAYSHDVGPNQNVGRIWAMSGRTRSVLYTIDHPEPQSCAGFACGLGWNLSNLGDVDGDGVNDLAAAANRQNVTAGGVSCTAGTAGCNASQGKAYVFSGAPGKPRAPLYDLNNPAPQAEGYFGWASTAGDVVTASGAPGRDGISEVLVGAFQNDVPAGCGNQSPVPAGCRKDQGQAFIFNGAPNLPAGTARLVRTLDIPPEDRYVDPASGTCVSADPAVTQQQCGGLGIVNEGVGDVNRDGFWDQSVTAWTTGITAPGGQACRGTFPEVGDACNERQGRIYLYSGRDGSLLRKIDDPVPQQGALFGLQIVQAGAPGDVNADGFDDFYANGFVQSGPPRGGAPPISGEGRAWVFSGQAISSGAPDTPFSTPLLSLLDPTPEGSGTFGYALEKTDYDRDGRPDLHVGSFAGSYVFDGDNGALFKTFDLPPEDAATQPPGNTNLGRSVAAPGDLNGDCEPDFLSGSPGHDVAFPNDGRAYVYLSRGPSGCPVPGPGNPPRPRPSAPFADCPALSANLINGTAGAESINGTSGADRIFAGTGDDAVDGLAGNDCIDLGPGTDRGQGGDGADLVVGGLGPDRMAGNLGADRLRGGSSGDRLIGGFGDDRLHGQSGADRLNGERGRDRINGGSSNDVISAGSSGDRVAGDQGGDRINGNSGNDSLSGNSGKDRITGSTGSDRISGGSGGDRIAARDGRRDRVNCGTGRDSVVADSIDVVSRNCERVSRRGRRGA